MSGLLIREVDAGSDAQVAAWLDVHHEAEVAEVGRHATPFAVVEMTSRLRLPRRQRSTRLLIGAVDGEPVAAGTIELPLLDNLASAFVAVDVRPGWRRRGHGTAMLAALESGAAAAGRHTLESEARWRLDGPGDGSGAAGVAFARRHGFRVGLIDVQRELGLPVADDLLGALEQEAAAHAGGYRLRTHVGALPDDDVLRRGYLELANRINSEAPAGDMEWEDEAVDLAAFAEEEAILAASDRLAIRVMARDARGAVVAHSDLVVPRAVPGLVFQLGTLVDPAHRGHRLGLATKAAGLRALAEAGHAAGRRIVTWNAADNTAMVAINERLGYEPVAWMADLLKRA